AWTSRAGRSAFDLQRVDGLYGNHVCVQRGSDLSEQIEVWLHIRHRLGDGSLLGVDDDGLGHFGEPGPAAADVVPYDVDVDEHFNERVRGLEVPEVPRCVFP